MSKRSAGQRTNPVVTYYPRCAECETAFVLRRCLSLSRGAVWLWQRDCKHKKADLEVVAPDGTVRPNEPAEASP